MQVLTPNSVFKLIGDESAGDYPSGLYRVVFNEPVNKEVVVVCLDVIDGARRSHGGRPPLDVPKRIRKKKPLALVGALLWLELAILESMSSRSGLLPVTIENESIYLHELSEKDRECCDRRIKTMSPFLDFDHMQESILVHHGIGGLVKEAMDGSNVSRPHVYALWSKLCRYGFTTTSLRPRWDRCGAPGVQRPCAPGGRLKSGRKTVSQRISAMFGPMVDSPQRGMSLEWRAAILAADRSLKTPVKPKMKKRYEHIVNTAFVARYKEEDGQLLAILPEMGSYPNLAQVRRVLTKDVPLLERLRQSTTEGHYSRSSRGLTSRNWKGVAGPGHTWAIDSTVGDIYLRSSIDRSWIIGRPIVYVVVDVWSTAVVGFHVCLEGPSWDMARLAIFNCVVDPKILTSLWGFNQFVSLNPWPTLPHCLLCDRGEYLSKKATFTMFRLIGDMAYTPPYRPDLKSIVEVLHRIAKDQLFLFAPGAMDYRRKEFELRRSDPSTSALTLKEFAQVLHIIFSTYNLTADRSNRLDAHMWAQNVVPSPAGLWRWGHQMGIGFGHTQVFSELGTRLLHKGQGWVNRSSVRFSGLDFMSDFVKSAQWTSIARAQGGWDIPVFYHPASVSRIWTPHQTGSGLLELELSDQANASSELTFDERSDAFAYSLLKKPAVEHEKLLQSLSANIALSRIFDSAKLQTKRAEETSGPDRPSHREARTMETMHVQGKASPIGSPAAPPRDDALEAHREMMESLYGAMNATQA